MLSSLLDMSISFPEKVIRTIVVYLVVAAIVRVVGKRDFAQLNSMDLVVVLLLSNVVQNAIIGPDNSLVGGLIGAVVLVGFNALVNWWARRSERVDRFFNGTATVLASDGSWDERALAREGLRATDAELAVRRQNGSGVQDAASVSLEPGGSIVVTLKEEAQPATQADVQRLEKKLDALLARA